MEQASLSLHAEGLLLFRVKIQAAISYRWLISIQPLGRFTQEPESRQATGMALARCIQGIFLEVRCFPLPLDVPTFAARCLHLNNASAPRSERWNCGRISYPQFSRNDEFSTPFRDILHAANLRHGTYGSHSSPKEGILNNFCPKNQTASVPLGTRG
jgi:hypothetical protein